MSQMATVELRYVKAYTDRHCRRRHYFRRPGYPRTALPGEPGSAAFVAAYAAALAGERAPIGTPPERGSVAALIVAYLGSDEFLALAEGTRRSRRRLLDAFREKLGERPYKGVTTDELRGVVVAVSGPQARRNRRKAALALWRFAKDRRWVERNPAADIRLVTPKSDGYAPWTEADVTAFRKRWPGGTRQRLALELMLGTGQRRGDVVRMGRQHLRDGRIRIQQSKTAAVVNVPVHPDLKPELAAAADRLTFLLTEAGRPFTAAGFGNWFRDAARAAGVTAPGHGLRKLAATRLADAGCTPHEIAAVTGHKTLSEVERYTRSADQTRLATSAMKRLGNESGAGGV